MRDYVKFLEGLGTLPKLLEAGLQYIGIKEISGNRSNPVILSMAKTLKVDNIYNDDDISWCALLIAFLCVITGKPMKFKGYEILRAMSFKLWGMKQEIPMLGDVLVFKREGGGHVGLYVAETKTTYIVFGGNQSNTSGFTEIKKERLVACRRYYETAPPDSVKRYFVDSEGKLSTNEK